MKISNRKKTMLLCTLILGGVCCSRLSCTKDQDSINVYDPQNNAQVSILAVKAAQEINDQHSFEIINDAIPASVDTVNDNMAANANNTVDMSSIPAFCNLLIDVFTANKDKDIKKSLTSMIQELITILTNNKQAFVIQLKSEKRVDHIISVLQEITNGIKSGRFIDDSNWAGVPGESMMQVVKMLKQFIPDLPQSTRDVLSVGKVGQYKMAQVLRKRLAQEKK